jgi:hypothetical protein|tara:strand:- start:1725 stop:2489 length:765 start_codon:yes stop_codon:yes gene_type:complete
MVKSLFSFKLALVLLVISTFSAFGQEEKNPEQAWLISPSMSIQSAGGDFAERFKTFYTAGIGLGYKTNQNWIFSFNGHFMFGNSVQNSEQILRAVITDNNNILNQTGNYAQLSLLQRGFYFLGESEKLFNQLGTNPNSGLSISVGAGFINHWIFFDNAGDDSPQILDEYGKGYDRYSGGALFKQSIGYTYLSNRRRINFKISFEILEAFTYNYREFNYDTGLSDTEQHLDLLYGIRLNWYLPIYQKANEEFFYD